MKIHSGSVDVSGVSGQDGIVILGTISEGRMFRTGTERGTWLLKQPSRTMRCLSRFSGGSMSCAGTCRIPAW